MTIIDPAAATVHSSSEKSREELDLPPTLSPSPEKLRVEARSKAVAGLCTSGINIFC